MQAESAHSLCTSKLLFVFTSYPSQDSTLRKETRQQRRQLGTHSGGLCCLVHMLQTQKLQLWLVTLTTTKVFFSFCSSRFTLPQISDGR